MLQKPAVTAAPADTFNRPRHHLSGRSFALRSQSGKRGSLHSGFSTSVIDDVLQSIRKTRAYFIAEQRDEGFWWSELESNVTMTAEYLMMLHFLGIHDPERERRIANHILKHQRVDGTWALFWGGKGDLSTTVEAYFSLKLAGHSADEPAMRKAREFVFSHGGVEASRVFTKIFLALFGELEWEAVPSIPAELMMLPPWAPFNIYSMSSWARTTLVPLSVVSEFKPVRTLPEDFRIGELFANPGNRRPPLVRKKFPFFSWKRFFLVVDKVLKGMDRAGMRPFRKKGLQYAERWILDHQEESGDWAGIQPPMIYSIIALSAMGHDLSFEAIQRGLKALKQFTIERGDELILQSCISPVWDTALTSLALFYSGLEEGHPSLQRAASWLASKQIVQKGDWSAKRPCFQPGGWAFEFENSWYPDIDDTSVVLMLLKRLDRAECFHAERITRGVNWVLGMQGKDGGWGAFDVDNNMKIWNQVPFGDLEAMIDPSTPDITGRALEILGLAGYGTEHPSVRKAVGFLLKEQEKDGPWWGRWGVNYIYGTWSVLMGLRSVGENMSEPYVRKAVEWLKSHQNLDGGWGECCESYEDACLKGIGMSTPSQTAWAVMALIAAGEGTCDEARKGLAFLLEKQREDGTWDEKEFVGTGFPRHFMLRYHNYRNCFPLMAFGIFIRQFGEADAVGLL
jgi:squalene-hopene/tetraprenyl-beta-curcumene cyclase